MLCDIDLEQVKALLFEKPLFDARNAVGGKVIFFSLPLRDESCNTVSRSF